MCYTNTHNLMSTRLERGNEVPIVNIEHSRQLWGGVKSVESCHNLSSKNIHYICGTQHAITQALEQNTGGQSLIYCFPLIDFIWSKIFNKGKNNSVTPSETVIGAQFMHTHENKRMTNEG